MKDLIRNQDGQIIYLSPTKFKEVVIQQKNCFICGRSSNDVRFNKEHIFPDWILRDFEAYKEAIDLPNKEKHSYGTYTVPCCSECNNRMGNEIEKPLSEAIKSGYSSVVDYIDKNGHTLIYEWLARIFLKTHLKDSLLRKSPDFREGSAKIGDNYKWEGLYFPFCFSRAFYAKTVFDPRIMGSFLVFPVEDKTNDLTNRFLYVDDTDALVVLLQIRNIGFIASFNDFGIALHTMSKMLDKINRPLNVSQLAELAAHVAILNRVYTNRPSVFYAIETNSFISVPPKETPRKEVTDEEWGSILYHFTHKLIPDSDLLEKVRSGKQTFLWSKDGALLTTHLA